MVDKITMVCKDRLRRLIGRLTPAKLNATNRALRMWLELGTQREQASPGRTWNLMFLVPLLPSVTAASPTESSGVPYSYAPISQTADPSKPPCAGPSFGREIVGSTMPQTDATKQRQRRGSIQRRHHPRHSVLADVRIDRRRRQRRI